MKETQTTETDPTAENEAALRRRLLNRIAIAGVMVVGLLGSLTMFDAIFTPSPPLTTKVASVPARGVIPPATERPAVAETKPAEPAVEAKPAEPAVDAKPAGPVAEAKPAGSAAETKTEPAVVAKAEPVGVPERTAAPGAPPLQPLPAEKPLTRPATGRPASIRPPDPVPLAAVPAPRTEPARELASAGQSHNPPLRAPASRPISGLGDRLFALQMGVFSNVANAEDLRAKLELHGISSTIEARVHVGPFQTREEADAVRAKLHDLGLDVGVLVTMKTK